MKYLKYLQTITDFELFKNSDEYITPNVSFIEETKVVNYEPLVTIKLITFTISGTEFQVEEGMTWVDWYHSSYPKDIEDYPWYISDRYGYYEFFNLTFRYSDGSNVDPCDMIIEGHNYKYKVEK